MPLEQWISYVPAVVIVLGVLLVAWSERARIQAAVRGNDAPAQPQSGLTPAERFDKFYALRNWCEQANAAEAVKALDGVVLPAIVQGGGQP